MSSYSVKLESEYGLNGQRHNHGGSCHGSIVVENKLDVFIST